MDIKQEISNTNILRLKNKRKQIFREYRNRKRELQNSERNYTDEEIHEKLRQEYFNDEWMHKWTEEVDELQFPSLEELQEMEKETLEELNDYSTQEAEYIENLEDQVKMEAMDYYSEMEGNTCPNSPPKEFEENRCPV